MQNKLYEQNDEFTALEQRMSSLLAIDESEIDDSEELASAEILYWDKKQSF